MEQIFLSDLFNIPEFNPKGRYWLVRTEGGKFYNDFKNNEYVGIGWDYLTLDLLQSYKTGELTEQHLKNIIATHEGLQLTGDNIDRKQLACNKRDVTKILNKISNFVFDVSIGDIVVCPSKNSRRVLIGIFISDIFEDIDYIPRKIETQDKDRDYCTFYKRRKVKWINTIYKGNLDIYLQNVIKPHQAIYPVDEFASIINRNLTDVYIKDNSLHGIIKTKQTEDISLEQLKTLVDYIYDSFDEVSGIINKKIDRNSISVKINIHSPGLVEIAAFGLANSLTLAVILSALSNYKHGDKISHKEKELIDITNDLFDATGTDNEKEFIDIARLKVAQKSILSKERTSELDKLENLDLIVPEVELSDMTENLETVEIKSLDYQTSSHVKLDNNEIEES